jgi:asparagine synthase (glutamine-hydrolysing)
MMPAVANLLPSGRQNLFMDKARYAKRFIQAGTVEPEERYAFYLAIADRQICQELLGDAANLHRNGLESIAIAEGCSDPLLRYLRIDWRSQLAENLLLMTDKLTMACSLECRVPFLDHKLVELAARIPADHKMPNGRLKGLLKDALSPVLPQSVIHRRKRGFGAPVGAWFKSELVPIIDVLLGTQSVAARGFFDPAVIESIRQAHQHNAQDYSDLLLALINIEIWARLFLEGQSYQDISDELCERATN